MNSPHIYGSIESLTRLPLSVNGNPRFKVRLRPGAVRRTAGMYRTVTESVELITQSDSMFAYAIENREYTNAQLVDFTLSKAGRIMYGEVAKA